MIVLDIFTIPSAIFSPLTFSSLSVGRGIFRNFTDFLNFTNRSLHLFVFLFSNRFSLCLLSLLRSICYNFSNTSRCGVVVVVVFRLWWKFSTYRLLHFSPPRKFCKYFYRFSSCCCLVIVYCRPSPLFYSQSTLKHTHFLNAIVIVKSIIAFLLSFNYFLRFFFVNNFLKMTLSFYSFYLHYLNFLTYFFLPWFKKKNWKILINYKYKEWAKDEREKNEREPYFLKCKQLKASEELGEKKAEERRLISPFLSFWWRH